MHAKTRATDRKPPSAKEPRPQDLAQHAGQGPGKIPPSRDNARAAATKAAANQLKRKIEKAGSFLLRAFLAIN